MISSAMAKVTTTRPMLRRLTVGWSRSSTQKQAQTNTMNHGSVRGPEPQAADEHREQHHGGRDEVRVDERADRAQHGEEHQRDHGRAVGDRHLPAQAQGPAAPGTPMTVRHSVPRSALEVSACPAPAKPDIGPRPERPLILPSLRRANGMWADIADTRTYFAHSGLACAPWCRTPGTAARSAGRRRPRRRGRRPAPVAPWPPGVCSGRTVSMDPVRTPSAISSTRSCQIAWNWPTRRRLPGTQRVDPVPEQHLGAVDVPDAGEHRLVHQQVGRSAGCSAAAAPTPSSGRRRPAAGPGRARRAPRSRCSAPIRSHWVAPRRSAYVVSFCRRSRTWPTGGGAGRRAQVELADQARGARGRSDRPANSTNRCLPAESAPTTTWPSTSAASAANLPCGLLTRTGRPAKAASRSSRGAGGCAPQASCAERGVGQRRQVAGRLVVGEHRDAAHVPLLAGEVGVQEDADEAGHLLEGVHPAADGEHVGVVVLAGERRPSRRSRPARRGPRRPCWPRSARRCRSRRSPRRGSPGRRPRPRRRAGRRPGSRRGRRRRTGRGRRARDPCSRSHVTRWSLRSRPAWSEPRCTRMSESGRPYRLARGGERLHEAGHLASERLGGVEDVRVPPEPVRPGPGSAWRSPRRPPRRGAAARCSPSSRSGSWPAVTTSVGGSRRDGPGRRGRARAARGRGGRGRRARRRTAPSTRRPRAGRSRRPRWCRSRTTPSGRGTGRSAPGLPPPPGCAAPRPARGCRRRCRRAGRADRSRPWAAPSRDHPGEDAVDVVGRRREPVLGRASVVDAEHGDPAPVGRTAGRGVVHLDVVEDEAAAVQVDQQTGPGTRRSVEPARHPVGVEVDAPRRRPPAGPAPPRRGRRGAPRRCRSPRPSGPRLRRRRPSWPAGRAWPSLAGREALRAPRRRRRGRAW